MEPYNVHNTQSNSSINGYSVAHQLGCIQYAHNRVGIENKSDVGVMQVNTYYHGKTADKLGLGMRDLFQKLLPT